MKRLLIAVAACLLAAQAHCQVAPKTSAAEPTQIEYSTSSSGEDNAGAIFATALQRALNNTEVLKTVSSRPSPAVVVTVQTMGMDDMAALIGDKRVLASIYQVVVLIRGGDGTLYYLNSFVGYCGQDKAQAMAQDVANSLIQTLVQAANTKS